MIYSSMCRICHRSCCCLCYQFILMGIQLVSRCGTRKRYGLQVRQRVTGFKFIQYVILVLHMLYICATKPPPKKTMFDSHHCMLKFLLYFIPCVKTSISVTLINMYMSKTNHIHLSHSTLKIWRYMECTVLVVGGFQRRFFRIRWKI